MRTIPFSSALLWVAMPVLLWAHAGLGQVPADRSRHGDPPEFEVRDRPVTDHDLQILARAVELLGSESAWNRSDDRHCKDDEALARRSLFCALHAASVEVLGSYDHRRVALQEVRFAIQEVAPEHEFGHRLMEFNNLPSTTLADLHQVLRIARHRVGARLEGRDPEPAEPPARPEVGPPNKPD